MFKHQKRGLSFPNNSRSFDNGSERIRFWAYDGAIEVSIFVESDLIRRLSKTIVSTEDEFLSVFDNSRQVIHDAAERIYRLGPKGIYTCVLSAENV